MPAVYDPEAMVRGQLIELSPDNIREYVAEVVLPALPTGTAIENIHQVTENSSVNWIFAVNTISDGEHQTIYVRQSRDHVRAYPHLKRDVARTYTEERALAFLNEIEPGTVPKVLLFDWPNNVLVLSDIKRNGKLLADELTVGNAHAEIGSSFGNFIGTVQTATRGRTFDEILGDDVAPPKAQNMADYLGPRTERARELNAGLTESILAESDAAPQAFILGDLAPKNIFAGDKNASLLDFERVFVGDPAYDPAYLFAHVLVEIKGEGGNAQTLEFIDNFMTSYTAKLSERFSQLETDALETRVLRYMGMSILHRTSDSYVGRSDGLDKKLWQERALKLMASESNSVVRELHLLLGAV